MAKLSILTFSPSSSGDENNCIRRTVMKTNTCTDERRGAEQEKCSLVLCIEAVPIDTFTSRMCDGDSVNLHLSEESSALQLTAARPVRNDLSQNSLCSSPCNWDLLLSSLLWKGVSKAFLITINRSLPKHASPPRPANHSDRRVTIFVSRCHL